MDLTQGSKLSHNAVAALAVGPVEMDPQNMLCILSFSSTAQDVALNQTPAACASAARVQGLLQLLWRSLGSLITVFVPVLIEGCILSAALPRLWKAGLALCDAWFCGA